MLAQLQATWWVTGILVPAIFTVLGAVVGFLVGEIKDKLQDKRSKEAFLRAIAVEAASIKASLEEAAEQSGIFVGRLQQPGHGPRLVPRWGTMVFDSQLGKLRGVADDLVLHTIETYAKVGQLERIVEIVNQLSQDYMSAAQGNEKATAQARLMSALLVFREEATLAVSKFQALIQKLPSSR